MRDGKIIIARLWPRYSGGVPSRAPIMLGIEPDKYETLFIYLKQLSEEPNYFEDKGHKAYYLSKKRHLKWLNIFLILRLVRILKKHHVDIVHSHRHQACIYGTIAAKIAGVPIIFAHVHGLNRSKTVQRKFINMIVFRWVNKIFTVGNAVKNDVLKNNPFLPAHKVLSLGNSIDCNNFANPNIDKAQAKINIGLEPNSLVFGAIGRLSHTKGYPYLIKAFARVKEQVPSASLILVGNGNLKNKLKKESSRTKAGESIHFLGHRKDIPDILNAMDIYVLSSLAEGMPRSLLEAISAGIPCIATNVGGIPEILFDIKYGLLVKPKDEISLAEAMLQFARMTNSERENIIRNAKQMVESKFSHAVVIKKLENIYQEELKNIGIQ